jgi:hypothetical protein
VSGDPPDPSGVFAELRRLVAPERVLRDARADGAGVRVAVIDSGIERAALESRHKSCEQIEGAVFVHDRSEPLPYDGRQSTPHGTTVADILLTLAPRVRLFSADVFGPRGVCEVEVLLRALRHAVEVWNCHIVNLSLGVSEERLQQLPARQRLLRAIEEAYYRDVLVVAAAHNDHPLTRSYPAVLGPALLAVDKRLFANPQQVAYEPRDRVEFAGHGRGYFGPFAHEPATSWAAPHVAAVAARLLSLRPGLKPFELKTLLYWMAGPEQSN